MTYFVWMPFFPPVVFFFFLVGGFFFIFIVPLGLKGVGFLYMCNKVVIRMFLINKFYQMDVISLSQFTKCNIFIWCHCFQYVSSICIYSFLLICESIWLHVYSGTAHKENKKNGNFIFLLWCYVTARSFIRCNSGTRNSSWPCSVIWGKLLFFCELRC